jgi:hypothetical protein
MRTDIDEIAVASVGHTAADLYTVLVVFFAASTGEMPAMMFASIITTMSGPRSRPNLRNRFTRFPLYMNAFPGGTSCKHIPLVQV